MPTIMLIEDDAVMRSLLNTLLELEGYTVVDPGQIGNIDQCLESIRSVEPDLVVLDVNLGSINGYDLVKKLRAAKDLSDVRVIMSSGMDQSQRWSEAGADGFIMKPYMPDDLLSYINKIIGN